MSFSTCCYAHLALYQQFWSAYVPCGSQYLDSVQLTLEQIDVIHRLVDKYPNQMQLVTSAQGEVGIYS